MNSYVFFYQKRHKNWNGVNGHKDLYLQYKPGAKAQVCPRHCLTVYFLSFTPLEVLIEIVMSAVFVRAGTQSFCWDRRALECVFLCSRWWWWRARQNRQPSASWELYVFLWVLPIRLSITQCVLQRHWSFFLLCVCREWWSSLFRCLFAKLVSYTFLFWLPLYITKAGNSQHLIRVLIIFCVIVTTNI